MEKHTESSNILGKSLDNNSQINLIDTGRSSKPLNPEKKERNASGKTNKEIMEELDQLENPENSFDDDKIKPLISEEIKEIKPNDFGYFTLFHTGDEFMPGLIKNEKTKEKSQSFYIPGNFSSHLNDRMGTQRSLGSPLELIIHFAKEENNHYSELGLDNPFSIRLRRENKMNSNTKKMTTTQSMIDNNKEEDLIRNTQNSCIKELQLNDIIEGKIEDALKRNMEYKLRKLKYEVELIKLQLKKLSDFENQNGIVEILSPEPYRKLKDKSKKFLENYEKFLNETNLSSQSARKTLEKLSEEARSYLINYMAGIIREYQKSVSDKKGTINKGKSYIKWKSKISQLVGLWDLSNSSGIQMTATYKYLIIKKFLYVRSINKRINKEFIELPPEEGNTLNALNLFAGEATSDSYPIGIFSETDNLRYVMDVVVAILLLYCFYSIPTRFFLGNETKTFKLIEKFVDAYLYVDILVTFRTAFKDKFNEDIYDVLEITKRYLTGYFLVDILSTIPWFFFLISFDPSIMSLVRIIAGVLKILRIIKLLPILNKLEQLKAANYFRLIKLLLIYFMMSLWMGCILYYGINDALTYSSLNEKCYKNNYENSKFTLNNECKFIISFYNANYIIPGQYTNYMQTTSTIVKSKEYLIMIFEYLLGQVVSAYIFGGITSIIQNLDQGSNFFTEKTDLLREHMLFYDMKKDIQNDVTVYYDYLWQRHKDVIYGKHHFNLLSKSLREKFENINLLGNEIYLHIFHNLKNPKLIGHMLREMKKIIIFPYEILYEEGSLVKGLYILTNGDIEFSSVDIENVPISSKSVEFANVMKEINNLKTNNNYEIKKDLCVIFPFLSAFIKTGRTYQRCFALDFTDLLYLPLSSFDDIIQCFPVEMHSLKHEIMYEVEKKKLFENGDLFKAISLHSARSVGKNFEKEYTKLSIWIPIPIPISQRKIATNYIESFVKKVKNQWKEILISSDLNICLNSMMVVGFLKTDKNKSSDKKEDDKQGHIQQSDQLDMMKNISRTMSTVTDEFIMMLKQHNY